MTCIMTVAVMRGGVCLSGGESHMLLVKSLQLCPTLCHPMDCSPPGFSVHGILQAQILEWVAMSASKGPSQPRDWSHVSHVSCTDRHVHYLYHHLGSPTSVQIYLFIFGCIGSFSSCSKWGLLSSCGAWVSHCNDFSHCWAQAAGAQASVVAAHRLRSHSLWAQAL